MKRILVCLMAMLVMFVLVTLAHATLINRGADTLGNRLIYDTDYDITWYDFTNAVDQWQDQVNWAGALSVNFEGDTYDDWRLPTALNFEAPFGPDLGWIQSIGSEMGHLYYTELGNAQGGPLSNTGDFQNIIDTGLPRHWTSTEVAGDTHQRLVFRLHKRIPGQPE